MHRWFGSYTKTYKKTTWITKIPDMKKLISNFFLWKKSNWIWLLYASYDNMGERPQTQKGQIRKETQIEVKNYVLKYTKDIFPNFFFLVTPTAYLMTKDGEIVFSICIQVQLNTVYGCIHTQILLIISKCILICIWTPGQSICILWIIWRIIQNLLPGITIH